MSYINKNANLVLLFLIVAAITVLVGATVYFQENFDELNQKYDDEVTKLESARTDLLKQSMVLNQTKSQLTLKSEREEEFTEQYTEVKGEKEEYEKLSATLQRDKAQLETDLGAAQNQLSEYKAKWEYEKERSDQLNLEKEQLETEVQSLESMVDNLEDDIHDICDEADDLNVSLSEC